MVKNDITSDQKSVFFSYSRQDQARALPIIKAIEDAGYSVWWDGMLEGGSTFLETTENALEAARAVVVLWSKSSVQSHWVRDEATSGRVRERLIPLSLDDSVPPLGFRQIQLIDFSSWKPGKPSPSFDELASCLSKLHGDDSVDYPKPAPPTVPDKTRRRLLFAAVGVAIVALGGLFLPRVMDKSTPEISINSVAVLPFKNLSNDPALDYLATGLASELRLSLARNKTLKVAARSSSEAIAKHGISAQDVAAQLGVAHVIDGSISKFNETMKVATELIDGETGFALSVQVFEHPLDDALDMRNHIVNSVTELLTIEVSDVNLDERSGSTQNAAAFNEYLKGYDQFLSNSGPQGAREALDHIERAIEFDPAFGIAHALKARILLYLGGTAGSTDEVQQYFTQSKKAAFKAVELAPEAADTQSTLGQVLFSSSLDVRGAKAPFDKSIELDNRDPVVLARAATFFTMTGQDSKAQDAIKRARELDPLNLTLWRISGLNHYSAGRFQQAADAYASIISTNPDYRGSYKGWSFALYFLNEPERALSSCLKEKDEYDNLTCRAILHFKRGDIGEAEKAMDELNGKFGEAAAYQQAQIYAQWGEPEKSLQALELAFALGDPGLDGLYLDPMLEPVRDDPRFTNLLEKIGFID